MTGPIAQLHQDYLDQKISPLDVCKEVLRQAECLNPTLNAFTEILKTEALQAAEDSTRRYRETRSLSVLDGIPISVKDLFHMKGTVTGCGSLARESVTQTENAVLVDRLKELGAVLFGKANLLEYAYGLVHPKIGPARNPWDLRRTIGGSSSGSAAAVAAGLGLASIGTDTAGSIRNPAAFGGVVGFKPTYGCLSVEGLVPLSPSLDHAGFLARSVPDIRVIFQALTTEKRSAPLNGGKQWRITAIDLPFTTPDVKQVIANFIKTLQSTQSVAEDFSFDWETANTAALTIIAAEAYAIHAQRLPHHWDDYGEGTRVRLAAGRSISLRDYLRARQVAQYLKREWRQRAHAFEFLVLPTLPMTAPLEEENMGDDLAAATLYTSTFALLGVPAISVPIGVTASGLPVGLQIVGHEDQDHEVLEFAQYVEDLRGPLAHAPLYAEIGSKSRN